MQSKLNITQMEEKINKIQALATSDEKAKMIYMWVKSDVISLSEFKRLLTLKSQEDNK